MSLQQLLGIELPLIQAPMAGVQGSALVIAVSNTGGLGSLPCAMLGMDAIRQAFGEIRRHTQKPFNANFFCHTPSVTNPEQDRAWLALFAVFYAELGVDIADLPLVAACLPFKSGMAELVSEFKPEVVSFHFGLPSPELLAMVRSCGAKILSSATTVEEAVWLEVQGVDAVIAQGLEAGGHQGIFLTEDISTQMGTFALTPQVVAAVKIPVIAAGAITDARGVKAALDQGACAVQVGTAYFLCPEGNKAGN